MNMSNNLIIYNLATDLESDVLAAAHDWICEFSHIYDHVLVFSTIVGKTNLPSNCEVHQIGGRSIVGFSSAFKNLLKSIYTVWNLNGDRKVFYHMNHKAAIVVAPIFKLLKIKQIIWYSHSKYSFGLKFASFFVDYCVSTNSETFPFKSSKFRPIGHGIDQNKFNLKIRNNNESVNRTQIVASGRVVQIKNIEKMIEALKDMNICLQLIGSQPDSLYSEKLENLSEFNKVSIEFLEPISFIEINKLYSKFSFAMNCTPISVDKAILEASMCGCIPISDNANVLKATGMYNFWMRTLEYIPLIRKQVQYLIQLNDIDIQNLAKEVSKKTSSNNGLEETIMRIYKLMS